MKRFASVLVLSMLATAAVAVACDSACPKAKTASVTTVAEKTESKTCPCGLSEKCVCGAAEKAAVEAKATEAKSGCCAKAAATTVADKTESADAKSGCCAHAKAAAVAAKDSGCPHAAHATTVAAATETAAPKSGCCKSATATTVAAKSESGCAKSCSKTLAAVKATMPKMVYRVGDTDTCCYETASKLSSEQGKSMHYVVADKVFEDHAEAGEYLAEQLENEIKEMTTVQFVAGGKAMHCPVTAKAVADKSGESMMYRVGGVDFGCDKKAEMVAQQIKEKLSTVKSTYVVGDKTFCCDKMAAEAAKSSGEEIIIKVGDKTAHCPIEAKVLAAQAKIDTIVETATESL